MLVNVDFRAVICAHGTAEPEPLAGVPDPEVAGVDEPLEPMREDPHAATRTTPLQLRTAMTHRRPVGVVRFDAGFITASFPAPAG